MMTDTTEGQRKSSLKKYVIIFYFTLTQGSIFYLHKILFFNFKLFLILFDIKTFSSKKKVPDILVDI